MRHRLSAQRRCLILTTSISPLSWPASGRPRIAKSLPVGISVRDILYLNSSAAVGSPSTASAHSTAYGLTGTAFSLGRVLINAGNARRSALGANRTRRDGGNDVNDPEPT